MFWHKLALALKMSVKRCQQEVDSVEFARWWAYYEIDPFGLERFDLLGGIVASLLANINRKKGARAYKPADFMPKFKQKPKRRQTPEQMRSVLNLSKLAATKAKPSGNRSKPRN